MKIGTEYAIVHIRLTNWHNFNFDMGLVVCLRKRKKI